MSLSFIITLRDGTPVYFNANVAPRENEEPVMRALAEGRISDLQVNGLRVALLRLNGETR